MPWTLTDLEAPVVALALDGEAVVAGLGDGRVLRSDDGRGGWRLVAHLAPATALLATAGALLIAHKGGVDRVEASGRASPGRGLPAAAGVVALAPAGAAAVAGTRAHGVFRSDDGGASWADAGRGLPYRGAGLGVRGFAAAGAGLFVAHDLGVSRSPDGLAWADAGAGLPLRFGRLTLAAGGPGVLAEADGRIYALDGDTWVEAGSGGVALLGADGGALFGLDAAGGLVWRSSDGGTWAGYGEGLPAGPLALALGARWRLAVVEARGLWRRRASRPAPGAPQPSLLGVPPFLLDGRLALTVTLPAEADVVLALVDGAGLEVARLLEARLGPGAHGLALEAPAVEPGLYRCRLEAGGAAVAHPLAVLAGNGWAT